MIDRLPKSETSGPRHGHPRGWLVLRALLAADALGLIAAFALTSLLFGADSSQVRVTQFQQYVLFFLTLPGWVFLAKLHELYDHDEERTEHTTLDDFVGVLHAVTLAVWTLYVVSHITGLADPGLTKVTGFWAMAIAFIVSGRAAARALCRRSSSYIQNTLIVGAGDVGQLVGRKFVQHPEYGIDLVGFVDSSPRDLRDDLSSKRVLGGPSDLPMLIEQLDVERVVIAFSTESNEDTVELVARLKSLDVQIDIVPRLFDVVGPNVNVHSVEGLALLGLPSPKLLPFSRTIKRCLDIVASTFLLLLTAPLFAFIAWRIKRGDDGPILFRQERLGQKMQPFQALKFRTMKVDTDTTAHREFIRATMSASATPTGNGLYKLERPDAITPTGRWLRKTSLDELPQLLNVLRGEMSLVGPRPCLAYETETFAPHHFERFRVPAGITGLWQVTARAHSTFGEALDLDVAYARNWSLGLDLMLLLRTPMQLLRQRKGTA